MKTSSLAVSAVVICLLSSDVEARKRMFEKTTGTMVLESWPLKPTNLQQTSPWFNTYVQPSFINHDLCVF